MTAPAETGGQRRILVGVDGSPASVTAVRWAAAEARFRGMWLHVVHAREPRTEQAPYAPSAAGPDVTGHAGEEASLKELVQEAAGPDAVLQFEVVDGLPVRVLLDRAPGAAMLVLGSTRPPDLTDVPAGRPKAPLGPVARDCLRAATCPVVIVATPGVQAEAEPARPRMLAP